MSLCTRTITWQVRLSAPSEDQTLIPSLSSHRRRPPKACGRLLLSYKLCQPGHPSQPSDVAAKEEQVDVEPHLSDPTLGPAVLPVPRDDASLRQTSTAVCLLRRLAVSFDLFWTLSLSTMTEDGRDRGRSIPGSVTRRRLALAWCAKLLGRSILCLVHTLQSHGGAYQQGGSGPPLWAWLFLVVKQNETLIWTAQTPLPALLVLPGVPTD